MKGSQELTQLSRLTVALEEPTAAAQLLTAPANIIAASHDILAVQPLSERVLQQVRPVLSTRCINNVQFNFGTADSAPEVPALAAQVLSAPANVIAASHDILAVQPLPERVLQRCAPFQTEAAVHMEDEQ